MMIIHKAIKGSLATKIINKYTVETTKNVSQWTSGVVCQNGSFSDAKAQLDVKPINSHSSQVRWTDRSLEESPQEQVFLEKFFAKRNDLCNHSYM